MVANLWKLTRKGYGWCLSYFLLQTRVVCLAIAKIYKWRNKSIGYLLFTRLVILEFHRWTDLQQPHWSNGMQPVRRVGPYYHTPSYKLAIWTVNPCIPIIIKMHYFNLPWSLAMSTALLSTFCCFIQTPRGIRQWSGNGIPPWSWRTQTILWTVAYRFEWVHILSRCRGLWTAATTLHSAKTSTFESLEGDSYTLLQLMHHLFIS